MKLSILFFLLLSISFVQAQLTLTPIPTPNKVSEGKEFVLSVSATGGVAPYQFSDDTPYFDVTTLNPTTGLGEIRFIPGGSVGNFISVIIILDSTLAVDAQAVEFIVNKNPTITTSIPDPLVALNNTDFSYNIFADDVDGNALSFSSSNPSIPITTTVLGPPATGNIFLTQTDLNNLVANGNSPSTPTTTTITVNDNGFIMGFPVNGTDNRIINLVVNDPVTLNPIPSNSTQEDSKVAINISDYIINKIGTLTFSDDSNIFDINPTTGIIDFTLDHTAVLSATPPAEENKIYVTTITVVDSLASTASGIWTLNIDRVNDVPICNSIKDESIKTGEKFYLDYSSNASDEEGPLTFSDDKTFFDINPTTGIIDFTSNASMVGSNFITIIATDTEGSSCTSTFTLTVIGNQPPIFPSNKSLILLAIDDLYVDSITPDSNIRNTKYINVSGGDLLNSIKRGYLMFNLKPIFMPYLKLISTPPLTALTSAFLNLTIFNSTGIFSIAIHDVMLFNLNFINITYNNPGNLSTAKAITTTSGITNNTDTFDVTKLIDYWFNDTRLDRFLSINLSNELLLNNITYHSNIAANRSQSPILALNYLLNISDYNWTSGQRLSNVFVLNDFFYDPDGDSLEYIVEGALNVVVDIDSFSQVSLSNVEGFAGEELVTFIASDGIASARSNVVKLTVQRPPPFEVQAPQPEIQKSTKTKITKKVASIGIIFDLLRRTIEKGERIEVPIKIKNTGEVDLKDINLDLAIDEKDLKVFLSLGHIDSLEVGAEEELKMTLDTRNAEKSRYTISVNAKAKDIEESAVFILDVLQENIGTFEQIEIAKRLFKDNPECLEFQEIIKRAEEQLINKELKKSQASIESAIEGCKSLIREEEKPGLIKRDYENLIVISLIIMALTLFLVTLYLVYKRISYSFKEE